MWSFYIGQLDIDWILVTTKRNRYEYSKDIDISCFVMIIISAFDVYVFKSKIDNEYTQITK